jgi:hypothetical protein
MENPPRGSEQVRESHVDLGLASKAIVICDLGSGNHLIDSDVLEICRLD